MEEINQYWLTTFDNPYDPFDQFDDWYKLDMEKGYCTCSYVARIAKYSDDLTEQEKELETERAINEIIDNDFMNIYKKVTKTYKIQL